MNGRSRPRGGRPARERGVARQVQANVGRGEPSRAARRRRAAGRSTRTSAAPTPRARRRPTPSRTARGARTAHRAGRAARGSHCASVCQQATVSRPAERFSASVWANAALITSGASSTFSATAPRCAPSPAVLDAAERRVEHAEQQLHQHRDVARRRPRRAPRARPAPRDARSGASRSIRSESFSSTRLTAGEFSTRASLLAGASSFAVVRRARVGELRRQLVGEERRQLGVRRQLDQALGDARAKRAAGLPHLEQARDVPQRRRRRRRRAPRSSRCAGSGRSCRAPRPR